MPRIKNLARHFPWTNNGGMERGCRSLGVSPVTALVHAPWFGDARRILTDEPS
ncbi:MAG: hypothetical protein KC416_10740 [Myxococcales bacterium]|nr:hypothetical protein [Myxococcales bacterium]